jgi:tetratricopeptide (TPR) repeat protein
MRRRRITAFATLLFVVSAVGSAWLLQTVDRLRTRATLNQVLYISSPKLLKALSLGYHGLLADVYWTRVVQYYGEQRHIRSRDFSLLWPLLNITTQLDAHLIPAYQFGGTFLASRPPYGAGLPERAIELVESGIRNNPDDWHLYYNLGFIYYDLKDFRAAADAFDRGSRVPNAHPFLKIMAAQCAQHGGELRTAQMLWSAVYETSKDKYIRENAEGHLRALKADFEAEELGKIVAAFHQQTGRYPLSFAELARARMLPGIPIDPLGNQYQLDREGHVFVADPDNFPFIERALPPGYLPKSASGTTRPKS